MKYIGIPNLIEKAEEIFNLYPQHLLDLDRVEKENPRMVKNYNQILNSIANALIYSNELRFNTAATSYKNLYEKFMRMGYIMINKS